MTEASSDPDTTTVLKILRGAAEGSQDPDVGLAERLSRMMGAADVDVQAVLTELLRDAHRD